MTSGPRRDKKGTGRNAARHAVPNAPPIDYDAAVQQIWSGRSSWPADPEPWLAEHAAAELENISSWPGARSDFESLCAEGCHPYVLGLLLSLLRRSPRIDEFAMLLGSSKRLEADARRLEDSAALIEGMFNRLPTEATALLDAIFTKAAGATPAQQASHLRHTAQFFRILRLLSRRNVTQFLLYLISAYVEQSTASPHDAQVSGLIAAVRGNDYAEEAHKAWRSRNMQKFNRGPVGNWHPAEFLVGLNKLLPRPR